MSTQAAYTIDTDEVFDILRRRTAEKATILGDIDLFAITTDEKAWYHDVLEVGASLLFEKISADAQTIDDAYDFDVTTDMEITMTVLQPTYWDTNLDTPFLRQLIEYLINYVLVQWWGLKGLDKEMARALIDLSNTETAILSMYSNRTTKPQVKHRSF